MADNKVIAQTPYDPNQVFVVLPTTVNYMGYSLPEDTGLDNEDITPTLIATENSGAISQLNKPAGPGADPVPDKTIDTAFITTPLIDRDPALTAVTDPTQQGLATTITNVPAVEGPVIKRHWWIILVIILLIIAFK